MAGSSPTSFPVDSSNFLDLARLTAQEPRAYVAIVFILLTFVVVTLFRPGDKPAVRITVFLMLLIIGAAGGIAIGTVFQQKLDQPPDVELTAQGFTPLYASLPQHNGCWCPEGNPNVTFLNAEASAPTQIARLDAVAGEWASFKWDADYVCHKQQIKGYPANLGTIAFDGVREDPVPDIYGVARVRYAAPTTSGPHIARVNIHANCMDTHAANCGDGNMCPANGELQIFVHPKK